MLCIERHYSLKPFNTFGLDIFADYYTEINKVEDLTSLRRMDVFRHEKRVFIGGGSNVLFLNDFFEGLVIRMVNKGIQIVKEDENDVIVEVAAGENWADFVSEMVWRSYGGLENLSLIPGSVGAAPIQNIGAYGAEFKDCFQLLQAIDLKTGSHVFFDAVSCDFGYRTSFFKTLGFGRFVITSVQFKLSKHPKIKPDYGSLQQELDQLGIQHPGINDVSEAVCRIRQRKLPDYTQLGNAGSFFKNPIIHRLLYEDLVREFSDIVAYRDGSETMKVSAGWLIEKAGWKGKRIGNVGMHDKQALILVNYGNATGTELYNYAMQVQYDIKKMFGVLLEPEVNIIH
ncbi:MAG: UDP-N-acetylmuramate dehydrogenase [Bacteroidales bacterium]|nr:UDP-N-acetylmuramate dehydrogenase [Bacteroidales bacterium]